MQGSHDNFFIVKTEKDYDWVKIYDGSNSDSNLIKTLTGHLVVDSPEPGTWLNMLVDIQTGLGISSSGNAMYIELIADNNGYLDKGFLATFYKGKTKQGRWKQIFFFGG